MGGTSSVLVCAVLAALAVAGCAATTRDSQASMSPTGPKLATMGDVPNGSVRFVLLGDVGTGDDMQYAVANLTAKICLAHGCQFVLIAGDNIYSAGASSDHDRQFESKFERPYEPVHVPFYLVPGNHDNGGSDGGQPQQADHEVEYSLRTDRLSDKWHMPARWYTFTYGNVQFLGFDSGPKEVAQDAVWGQGTRGPTMQAWLTSAIGKSTATWKIPFAHHPYLSNGPHGNAGLFDNVAGRGLAYKQMIEQTLCGKVPLFLTGHDHDLNWLKPTSACGSTEFVVSGAGGADLYARRATPPLNDAYFEDYAHHGLFWFDVTGDTLTGVAYGTDGSKLYERSLRLSAGLESPLAAVEPNFG